MIELTKQEKLLMLELLRVEKHWIIAKFRKRALIDVTASHSDYSQRMGIVKSLILKIGDDRG